MKHASSQVPKFPSEEGMRLCSVEVPSMPMYPYCQILHHASLFHSSVLSSYIWLLIGPSATVEWARFVSLTCYPVLIHNFGQIFEHPLRDTEVTNAALIGIQNSADTGPTISASGCNNPKGPLVESGTFTTNMIQYNTLPCWCRYHVWIWKPCLFFFF